MLELAMKAKEREFPCPVRQVQRLMRQLTLLCILAAETPVPTLDNIADDNKDDPDLQELVKVVRLNHKQPEKAMKEIRRM